MNNKMGYKEAIDFLVEIKSGEIKLATNEQMYFLGRNGYFKSNGLHSRILPAPIRENDIFMIQPITSKGDLGRCRIELQRKDVSRFVELLNGLLAQ